jgi:hypothetical protein
VLLLQFWIWRLIVAVRQYVIFFASGLAGC